MIRRHPLPRPLLLAACGLGFGLVLAACGGDGGKSPFSYPTPDTHAKFFPLRSATGVSCHDPSVSSPAAPCIAITCSSCHTDTSATSTFKQVSCNTGACHPKAATDSSHIGVTGYGWSPTPPATAPTCLANGCHSDGSVQHPFFPRGPGTKHPYLCASCHLDYATVPRPTDWATNLGRMACVSCHCPGGAGAECQAVQPSPLTQSVAAVHAQVISNPDLGTSPSLWPNVPAGSGPSQYCLRCHDSTGLTDAYVPPNRTTHGAQRANDGELVGPLIPSKHAQNNVQLCLACHQLAPPLFTTTPPAPPFNSTHWAQNWTPTGLGCAAAACHPGQPNGP